MIALLKLLLAAARVTAAKQAIGAILARLALSVLLILTAIGLLLAGCAFGLYAAYILLCAYMTPAAAAASVGAPLTIVAVALIAVVVHRARRGQGRRGKRAQTATSATQPIDFLTMSLGKWVQANPGQATAAAFVIGFVVGLRR